MGHESPIELWSPNLTTFCFVGFGTDRLRCEEAMKTAGRENPNRWTPIASNRAHGAAVQHRSCSIKWAGKQEKLRPMEECFFLTSPFIELYRYPRQTRHVELKPWRNDSELRVRTKPPRIRNQSVRVVSAIACSRQLISVGQARASQSFTGDTESQWKSLIVVGGAAVLVHSQAPASRVIGFRVDKCCWSSFSPGGLGPIAGSILHPVRPAGQRSCPEMGHSSTRLNRWRGR